MTMLAHSRNRFEPASRRSGRRHTAVPAITMDLATLKPYLFRALGLLLMASAVAGVIVLKAAIFLSRINY